MFLNVLLWLFVSVQLFASNSGSPRTVVRELIISIQAGKIDDARAAIGDTRFDDLYLRLHGFNKNTHPFPVSDLEAFSFFYDELNEVDLTVGAAKKIHELSGSVRTPAVMRTYLVGVNNERTGARLLVATVSCLNKMSGFFETLNGIIFNGNSWCYVVQLEYQNVYLERMNRL